ncbi:MAG: hypothetical protein Q7S87_00360 [Agitococcus sp.]|nr:hypothetical protein [Agitococcus sp.]
MTTHHNRINIAPTRAVSLLTPVIFALIMKSQGEIATPEHIAAEQQLIDEVLKHHSTLHYKARLELRQPLEGYNNVLIANGLNYQERKLAIQAYANDLCTAPVQEQAA